MAVCLGCGLELDVNGNPSVAISAPACDGITTSGGTNSGIACITNPATNKKGLFVAPDAGGRAGRQAQLISNTFLGGTVGSMTFNTGNSGNAIYHVVDGATLTNHSCARTQTNGVQLHVVLNMNAGAGAKATFRLEDSYDGATWVNRIEHTYDNGGLSARDVTVALDSEVWIANAPLQTTKHYMRVVVTNVTGTFIIVGGSSSSFIWNYVGCGEL